MGRRFLGLSIVILLAGSCVFISGQAVAEKESVTTLQPVTLELTTHLGDDQHFREGDSIRLLISLDQDAYVLLVYEDAEFNLIQLLPNQHQRSHYFQAGLFIPFPPQNASFDLTVQAPFGKDRVWAFASDQSIPRLQGQELENGLRLLRVSISDIRSGIKQNSKIFFDETQLTIHTSE